MRHRWQGAVESCSAAVSLDLTVTSGDPLVAGMRLSLRLRRGLHRDRPRPFPCGSPRCLPRAEPWCPRPGGRGHGDRRTCFLFTEDFPTWSKAWSGSAWRAGTGAELLVETGLSRSQRRQELRVLVYPSAMSVPTKALTFIADALRAHGRNRGTRWRLLSSGRQALMGRRTAQGRDLPRPGRRVRGWHHHRLPVLLRFPGYSDTRSLARVTGLWPGMTWSRDCRLSG